MLPRWFRIVLVADIALLVAVAVLGARLALDGAHAAGRVISWAHPEAVPAPPPPAAMGTPSHPAPPASPATPGRAPLGPALLHRLDSDAASSVNRERGLLARLEEAIRVRIVDILERTEHRGRGG